MKTLDLLEGYLSPGQAATALRLSEVTLARWRSTGEGPSWCRIGKRVFYREIDLRQWIEAEVERSRVA